MSVKTFVGVWLQADAGYIGGLADWDFAGFDYKISGFGEITKSCWDVIDIFYKFATVVINILSFALEK